MVSLSLSFTFLLTLCSQENYLKYLYHRLNFSKILIVRVCGVQVITEYTFRCVNFKTPPQARRLFSLPFDDCTRIWGAVCPDTTGMQCAASHPHSSSQPFSEGFSHSMHNRHFPNSMNRFKIQQQRGDVRGLMWIIVKVLGLN